MSSLSPDDAPTLERPSLAPLVGDLPGPESDRVDDAADPIAPAFEEPTDLRAEVVGDTPDHVDGSDALIAPAFDESTDLRAEVIGDAPDAPGDVDDAADPIAPVFEEPAGLRSDDRDALRTDTPSPTDGEHPVAQDGDRADLRDDVGTRSRVNTGDAERLRAETDPAIPSTARPEELQRDDGPAELSDSEFLGSDDVKMRTEEVLARYDGLREAAKANPHVDQIARDSPDQIERNWLDYQAKVQSADPPDYDFARYLELVQRSGVRPGVGEWNLAAERGAAGEVVMTDPGRPNDRGFDLVTYAPQDDTIRLFDDKSVSTRVREVSALDQNLAVNLHQVAEDLAARAARGAPGEPHLSEVVARLTEAAERIAEIEADAQDRDRAVQRVLDGQVEAQTRDRDREVQRVLDELRIERVVTNTAGPAEAAISARLRDKGFRVG